MKKPSRILLLFFSLIFLVGSISANANCDSSLAKDTKDSAKKNIPTNDSASDFSDELSPLDTFTQDLEDVFDLIDSGEKKAALKILKSAQKLIRKIEELDGGQKSDFTKTVKKIINFVKTGENESALDLVDKLLNDLSDVSVNDLSPLEQVTQDLSDASDLLSNDNNKTALSTLKNVLSQISKVDEFTDDEIQAFIDTIKEIIQSIKDDDIDGALDLIDQILSNLSDSTSDDDF